MWQVSIIYGNGQITLHSVCDSNQFLREVYPFANIIEKITWRKL